MVNFNFSSLFLILAAAAPLTFASAPALQTIRTTTGLYISNVDVIGAPVTTSDEADNGFTFWKYSDGVEIQGKAGNYITPGPGNKYLVWDETSFKWSLVPLGGSSYYITAAFGPTLADLLWIEDGNRIDIGEAMNGDQFTID